MQKKILCTICARKNSQGLKNKNIKKIDKKPLFLITLDQATKSKIFEKIVINSDSEVIKKICKSKDYLFYLCLLWCLDYPIVSPVGQSHPIYKIDINTVVQI